MGPLPQPGCCRARMVRAGLGAAGRPAGWGGERPGQVTARDGKGTCPAALGCPGEDPSPPTVLQASRKAGARGKATATKQAQRGSSNVFSMFEQAQIQEFKEVSALPPYTLFSVTRGSGLCPRPSTTQDSPASCLHWGRGCSHWRL